MKEIVSKYIQKNQATIKSSIYVGFALVIDCVSAEKEVLNHFPNPNASTLRKIAKNLIV